jgi:hypothetical protein
LDGWSGKKIEEKAKKKKKFKMDGVSDLTSSWRHPDQCFTYN